MASPHRPVPLSSIQSQWEPLTPPCCPHFTPIQCLGHFHPPQKTKNRRKKCQHNTQICRPKNFKYLFRFLLFRFVHIARSSAETLDQHRDASARASVEFFPFFIAVCAKQKQIGRRKLETKHTAHIDADTCTCLAYAHHFRTATNTHSPPSV